MRCIICKKGLYTFESIFQRNHLVDYSICELCYTKHPLMIESHIIPIHKKMLTIIDMIYDGRYPSYSYDSILFKVIQSIGYLSDTMYILYEEIDLNEVQYLLDISIYNIILFNYKTL